MFGGDRGEVEVVRSGDGLRVIVERLMLGRVSVVLRGDELARFKRYVAAFDAASDQPEDPT